MGHRIKGFFLSLRNLGMRNKSHIQCPSKMIKIQWVAQCMTNVLQNHIVRHWVMSWLSRVEQYWCTGRAPRFCRQRNLGIVFYNSKRCYEDLTCGLELRLHFFQPSRMRDLGKCSVLWLSYSCSWHGVFFFCCDSLGPELSAGSTKTTHGSLDKSAIVR